MLRLNRFRFGRRTACESPRKAIYPEIRRRRIEALRPSSPGRTNLLGPGIAVAVAGVAGIFLSVHLFQELRAN